MGIKMIYTVTYKSLEEINHDASCFGIFNVVFYQYNIGWKRRRTVN